MTPEELKEMRRTQKIGAACIAYEVGERLRRMASRELSDSTACALEAMADGAVLEVTDDVEEGIVHALLADSEIPAGLAENLIECGDGCAYWSEEEVRVRAGDLGMENVSSPEGLELTPDTMVGVGRTFVADPADPYLHELIAGLREDAGRGPVSCHCGEEPSDDDLADEAAKRG